MRHLHQLVLIALLSVIASPALAARPIPLHHVETPYTGSDYWATIGYTRGIRAEVTRDLTLRGIEIWADFDASETCEPRVYDDAGSLRASGPPQSGLGTGSGAAVDWWTLPIDTELFSGEIVTLAVYCTSSSSTSFYPHRDPPSGQLDAEGYFVNVENRSFFGDGHPNGPNTWWGDWRIDIEQHGLHDEYVEPGEATTGVMSGSRGASFRITRDHLVTGVDLYVDLGFGETCKPQIFDANGLMIAEGTDAIGDGAGLHWYRSDLGVAVGAGAGLTVAMYCAQSTTYGRHWNDSPGFYVLRDDAVSVRGRSGGGDGVRPTNSNAITPIMQLREGEVELVDRDGMSTPLESTWSSWSWGWRFTPEVFMLLEGIESLNRYEFGNAFARVYDTATGTLIASGATPMPQSSELEWRVAPLPDVPLLPGKSYTVAVFYNGGSTNAPYYPGTSGTYQRPGALADVAFCGSGATLDVMPTNCSYNQRIERLLVSVPEPGFATGLALGGACLASIRSRAARHPRKSRA